MGMDVFGNKPHSKRGEYFRNNVWWWHPLWDYCCFIEPDLADKVPEAHNNSGDGLNAYDARQLAFLIKNTLTNGVAEKYIQAYYLEQLLLPDEQCFCVKPNGDKKEDCAICKGTGAMPHFRKSYHITIENIKEFSDFLMECGGFAIC